MISAQHLLSRLCAAVQKQVSRDTRRASKLSKTIDHPHPPNPNITDRPRCVASDVSADLHEQGELLDGNRQISGDSAGGGADSTEPPANGSLGDTLGSTGGVVAGGEQGDVGVEVDMKSPVSVVQEYDRKKKLAGDLGNGFVRFNLSPAKVSLSLSFGGIFFVGYPSIAFARGLSRSTVVPFLWPRADRSL